MQYLKVSNLKIARQNKTILDDVNFLLNEGEHILITGDAGSGKTSLGLALTGKMFYTGEITLGFPVAQVLFIPQFYKFKDKSGMSDFYYQQRYNSADADDALTVAEVLSFDNEKINIRQMLDSLNLTKRLHAPLIHLSSGERKKLQLIEAFTKHAKLIILDNPYIGLDTDSVEQLNNLFSYLANEGKTFILLGSTEVIPGFIRKVGIIDKQNLTIDYSANYRKPANTTKAIETIKLPQVKQINFIHAFELNNIFVSYGTKHILQNISWRVKHGEKWLLQGMNGAGKSTLLSLINGDHPQAYVNDIYLFDKKRGSGESVWEIKNRIGFISPEFHWNFNYAITAAEVVVTGIYDTLGLYKKPQPAEQNLALEYLSLLGISSVKDSSFLELSLGIQRMVLLARAMVKNPPLLIFDEPCQGLNEQQSQQFTGLIDSLFADSSHTIIYVSHRQDQIPQCVDKIFKL